jgi:hypothetical protein
MRKQPASWAITAACRRKSPHTTSNPSPSRGESRANLGSSTNAELRADTLYLWLRQSPPSEAELDVLTEEFVQAVQ